MKYKTKATKNKLAQIDFDVCISVLNYLKRHLKQRHSEWEIDFGEPESDIDNFMLEKEQNDLIKETKDINSVIVLLHAMQGDEEAAKESESLAAPIV